jgi:hypothetical protein
MKKTAIQELINVMEKSPSFEHGFEWKRVAKLFIEQEKQQICNAFESGEVCTLFKNEGNAIDYYNETYNNEKI